jgi:hypothetical protein
MSYRAVRLEIDTPPAAVPDCACSICRRKAALWANYSPMQVRIVPATGATRFTRRETRRSSAQLQELRVLDPLGAGRQELRAHGREHANDGPGDPRCGQVEKMTGP